MPQFIDCTEHTGPGPRGESACPLCLEQIEADTETISHSKCNTTFCRECLIRWAQQTRRGELVPCPMDRLIIGIGENDQATMDEEEEDDDDEADVERYFDNELDDEGESEGFDEESDLSSIDNASANTGRSADSNGDHIIFDSIALSPTRSGTRHPATEQDNEDDHARTSEDEDGDEEARGRGRNGRTPPLPSPPTLPNVQVEVQANHPAAIEPSHGLIRPLVRIVHSVRAAAGYRPYPAGPDVLYGLPRALLNNVLRAILDDGRGEPAP